MIGKGPKSGRYTVINFTEESQTIEIHTRSSVIYRQLKRNGFFPKFENEVEAVFHVPIRAWRVPSLPSPKRVAHSRKMAALTNAKRLEKRTN